MSLKLRFFIFVFAFAIIPTTVLGWMRLDFLSNELTRLGVSPEAATSVLEKMHQSILATGLVLAIVSSFFAFAFFRSFADPITTLVEAMQYTHRGDFSHRVSVTTRDEVGMLTEAFNAMATRIERYVGQLEEADRAKDNFLAILTHELRNPLAPIVTSLELLRMGELNNPEVERSVAIIDRQIANMRKLLDYLLDITRLKQGRIMLEKELIDFRDIISVSIETVMPAFNKKDQRVVVRVPDTPVLVNGDPLRLDQVLINLLKNASEHTPDGGEIVLDCAVASSSAVITVRDRGSGISEEDLIDIFTLFSRGASARHKPGGLGVGLYLVKTFVEMHGGKVSVRSEGQGAGAEFTFSLPLAIDKTNK